jgi:putative glutamine transport system substrate-binding protein
MKGIAFLLMVASLTTVRSQSYEGDTWARAKAAGQGTITLAYVETPGFVYRNKAGNLTGISVDIMNDFVKWVNDTKKVNLQSKFVGDGHNFRGMYSSVKASTGGVFGLGNITITDERKREVKFSQPFITNFAILITQDQVPTLTKLEDMSTTFGKLTAYTAKGTLNEKRILELKQKYFPAMKIVTLDTSPDVYQRLVNDANAFSYLDLAFYLEAVRERKNMKRHPVGDKAAEQFGFIMPINTDWLPWLPLLDEFFKSGDGYVNSRPYKDILIRHLGETGVKLLQAGK